MCHCGCWPPTPPREFRVKSRSETLCALANWQDRSSDSQEFSGADSMSPILVSLTSRKTLESFMVIIVWGDEQKLHETSGKFLQKMCAWLYVFSLHRITYILTIPPASLKQFLRAIWGAVSQAAVLILPPVKLNSQLSSAFFLVDRSDSNETENKNNTRENHET